MPRRNRQTLLIAMLIALVCSQRAGLAQRDRYGQMVMQALAEVQQRYLEPVETEQLFAGAMRGLVDQLDDFSEYVDAADFAALQENLDQQFGGVGIQVMLEGEGRQLTVITPLIGTPAFAAGVRAGDKILAINGENTEGFRLEEAMRRLRGRPGDPVEVTLQHLDEESPHTLQLVRAMIQTETVLGDHRRTDGNWDFRLAGADHLAYLRVSPMFSERTATELQEALAGLRDDPPRGVILDLRSNPGGLLEAAIDTCNLFVTDGLIVSTRGRGGAPGDEYYADGRAVCPDWPLVVLVNQFSASASEIVAACLQDHGRAQIVGERTFGKGSVQELIRLGHDGRALRLTTSSYWRPSGRNIHRTSSSQAGDPWGVLPDEGCQVPLEGKDLEALLRQRQARDIVRPAGASPPHDDLLSADPQLRRAVEVLSAQ